jgi:hypothetical protein
LQQSDGNGIGIGIGIRKNPMDKNRQNPKKSGPLHHIKSKILNFIRLQMGLGLGLDWDGCGYINRSQERCIEYCP